MAGSLSYLVLFIHHNSLKWRSSGYSIDSRFLEDAKKRFFCQDVWDEASLAWDSSVAMDPIHLKRRRRVIGGLPEGYVNGMHIITGSAQ
jgi:hypothetical protein